MKPITAIALLVLAFISIVPATPLPIREGSTTLESYNRVTAPRELPDIQYDGTSIEVAKREDSPETQCVNSGGHWSDQSQWCVCAGMAVAPPGKNYCPRGQGWDGTIGFGRLNYGAGGRITATPLAMVLACAAIVALL